MHNRNCIYFDFCGNEVEENASPEHAFPRRLMPREPRGQESPGIILEGYICNECNNKFGKLDEQVIKQSFVGWVHNEFETSANRGDSSFYHRAHHHFPPMRFLGERESGDFVVLVEPKDWITDENVFARKAAAPLPSQIILIRHDNPNLDADILKNSSPFVRQEGERDVYRGAQNRVVVFGPIAAKEYYSKPAEFMQKFLNKTASESFQIVHVPPGHEDSALRCEADNFIEFLENTGGATPIPGDESDFQLKSVIGLGTSDASRGIAKIAFHCFLYKIRQYRGDESTLDGTPIFDNIKAFIYNGDYRGRPIVDERPPNDDYTSFGENVAVVPSSNAKCNLLHIFSFYRSGTNIACVGEFYVGAHESSLFTVTLSGCDEDVLDMRFENELRIPYKVSSDHPMLKRILLPTSQDKHEIERGGYPGNPLPKILQPTDEDIARATIGDLSGEPIYNRIKSRLGGHR